MKKTITTFAIITVFANSIFAWSKTGHEIVAQIAKHYLDKATAEAVQSYLGTMSFEEAADWMDQVRGNHSYDYMKPWHYINIEKDATYVKTEEPNIINAIEDAIENLDMSVRHTKESISLNLKYIFHLIGDLHQPLHVGYGLDKGGNDIHVKFLKKKSNLHHVWDDDIIQNKSITAEDCLKLADAMTAKEIKSIQNINIEAWMNDSRSYLTKVYAFKGTNITENYIKTNTPIIKKQLLKAGLRLAAILNKVFKK